jgi:hypothetical protein
METQPFPSSDHKNQFAPQLGGLVPPFLIAASYQGCFTGTNHEDLQKTFHAIAEDCKSQEVA